MSAALDLSVAERARVAAALKAPTVPGHAHAVAMRAAAAELLRAPRVALSSGASLPAVEQRGAIASCEPEAVAVDLERCSCGAEVPAAQMERHLELAANPAAWSLHRELLRPEDA